MPTPEVEAASEAIRAKVTVELRCFSCNKKLAEEISAPYLIICPRCHTTNRGEA